MIPGVNIRGKASVASVNGARESGVVRSESLSRDFIGQNPLRKLLGSKKHSDCLKVDLNAAKIIAVQDYKRTKN